MMRNVICMAAAAAFLALASAPVQARMADSGLANAAPSTIQEVQYWRHRHHRHWWRRHHHRYWHCWWWHGRRHCEWRYW
jgi:hypothetical protein